MPDLTVACIQTGNYLGRGAEYVAKLERAVARNLTIPHTFRCLTESDLGTPRRGWWAKMELGRPGLFGGPVLYLDLDVVITANIDHLVELAATDPPHARRLWMRDDFSYSIVNPKVGIGAETRRMLGGPGCCNSSVMLWHGDAPWWDAWQEHAERYVRELHGDQNAITQALWPDRIGLLPNESIQSYKYGVRMRGERPAPIVVMHGEPKNHQLSEPWVLEHWK